MVLNYRSEGELCENRGLKKWTPAFFAPEHVEMIKNAEIEDIKVQKPTLTICS